MKSLFPSFIVALCVLNISVNAQPNMYPYAPPCMPEHGGISFKFPALPTAPEYTTDMPWSVLIGYIGSDSIVRNKTNDQIREYISSQPYNSDTLRQAMKYDYLMNDYNPIKYHRYMESTTSEGSDYRYRDGRSLHYYLATNLAAISPKPVLDYGLIRANIIAHIKVDNVYDNAYIDGGQNYKTRHVSATILDPIKGQVIPKCYSAISGNALLSADTTYSQIAKVGSCLQFEMPFEWLQRRSGYNGMRPYGLIPESMINPSWKVESGKEYIVFLNYYSLCSDSNNFYACLVPTCHANIGIKVGWEANIRPVMTYPIENGVVNDEGASLGFGANLTPAQYKVAIRARIDKIKNGELLTTTNKVDPNSTIKLTQQLENSKQILETKNKVAYDKK